MTSLAQLINFKNGTRVDDLHRPTGVHPMDEASTPLSRANGFASVIAGASTTTIRGYIAKDQPDSEVMRIVLDKLSDDANTLNTLRFVIGAERYDEIAAMPMPTDLNRVGAHYNIPDSEDDGGPVAVIPVTTVDLVTMHREKFKTLNANILGQYIFRHMIDPDTLKALVAEHADNADRMAIFKAALGESSFERLMA